MAGKNIAVFGIYTNRSHAEEAVTALQQNGFRVEDVSVLLPENLGSKALATEKSTKAPEGATVGAGTGGVIGGTLGLLAGIGLLAIPGLGPFIVAGPIVAALAGVGAGGVIGGFTGALIGLGIPEFEAKRYEGRLRSGGILLSVHCDNSDWVRKGKAILERTGAEDVSSTAEAAADFGATDRPYARATAAGSTVPIDYRRYESDFRNHYHNTYGGTATRYEEYSPGYEYGYRSASDARYRDRSFSEAEPELHREYEAQDPGAWDRMRESIRYGWDRLRGKR